MYSVTVLRSAQKELERLPDDDAVRVLAAIQALGDTPRPSGCVKLTNSDLWRIRVGQYRIIYQIKDRELVIVVVKVGNRRDIYR